MEKVKVRVEAVRAKIACHPCGFGQPHTAAEYIIPDFRLFLLAGRAIFTARNPETGKALTFKVARKAKDSDLFVASWLYGGDIGRPRDWVRVGVVQATEGKPPVFRSYPTRGVFEDARKAFDWLLRHADDPAPAVVYHEGRCGSCGRLLTDPVSILHAFGPECAARMGLERPKPADCESETVATARAIHRAVEGTPALPFRTERAAREYVAAELDGGLDVAERIEMTVAERALR